VEGVAERIVAAGSDAQGEGGEGDGGGRGARGGGRRAAVDGRGPPADAPCVPPPLRLSAEHRAPLSSCGGFYHWPLTAPPCGSLSIPPSMILCIRGIRRCNLRFHGEEFSENRTQILELIHRRNLTKGRKGENVTRTALWTKIFKFFKI